MKRTGFLILALLAGFSLAQYSGNIGIQTNSPSDGTVLNVTGGPVQFVFDFTAGGNDPGRASRTALLDILRGGSNVSRRLAPTNSQGTQLTITANVPYQVILGVPVVAGDSTLPLSRYTLTLSRGGTVVGTYTLDALSNPTVVYTGSPGGTQSFGLWVTVLVYSNDLLPGSQTITVPLTVVPTP
jgi:hypothetical protein